MNKLDSHLKSYRAGDVAFLTLDEYGRNQSTWGILPQTEDLSHHHGYNHPEYVFAMKISDSGNDTIN